MDGNAKRERRRPYEEETGMTPAKLRSHAQARKEMNENTNTLIGEKFNQSRKCPSGPVLLGRQLQDPTAGSILTGLIYPGRIITPQPVGGSEPDGLGGERPRRIFRNRHL